MAGSVMPSLWFLFFILGCKVVELQASQPRFCSLVLEFSKHKQNLNEFFTLYMVVRSTYCQTNSFENDNEA